MGLSSRARSLIGKSAVASAACLVVAVTAAGASRPASSSPGTAADTTARLVAKVAGPDPGPFGTSLEGAAFDAAGRHLYFVDTTAPAGRPKLMRLDLATRRVTDLYSDSRSMLNCVGFAPKGVTYLCDLRNGRHGGGRLVRYDPDTRRLTTVLADLGGTAVVPDDLTIDDAGDLYVADYQGTPTHRTGRILLRRPDGTTSALLTGLAHPNGITFTADQTALWIDQDLAGTLDHVAEQLSSPAATTPTVTLHTAAYLSLGANDYSDSLTVDGHGNVYLAVYGGSQVLVFDPAGRRIGRVRLPAGVPHVTHVAIEPGTRRAFVTASGPHGGYVYTFRALAAAPAGRPNGG